MISLKLSLYADGVAVPLRLLCFYPSTSGTFEITFGTFCLNPSSAANLAHILI